MTRRLVYLDIETTGLDPLATPYGAKVWEVAWAVGDGPIRPGQVRHDLAGADAEALRVNRYLDRVDPSQWRADESSTERDLMTDLAGAVIVAANPAFDALFLRRRWGCAPWWHRMLDIEVYAMPLFRAREPVGLRDIWSGLVSRGYGSLPEPLPEPDHTAAGDVACLRACHRVLSEVYGGVTQQTS